MRNNAGRQKTEVLSPRCFPTALTNFGVRCPVSRMIRSTHRLESSLLRPSEDKCACVLESGPGHDTQDSLHGD